MKKVLFISVSAVAVVIMTGCGTSAHRIDPVTQGVTTVRDVNTRDWQEVSARAVNSLVASGALVRQDGRKSIVMINNIVNSTDRTIKTQLLTNKMRQAMLASGKALVTTAVGANGPEDNATRQVRDLENDDIFNQATVQKRGTVISPDLSLSGEIIEQNITVGRTTESSFSFHVVMTDLATGFAVWEDTFDISKQETESLIKF